MSCVLCITCTWCCSEHLVASCMNGFLKKIGETIIFLWVLVFMFSHFSLLIILVCLFLNNCRVYLLLVLFLQFFHHGVLAWILFNIWWYQYKVEWGRSLDKIGYKACQQPFSGAAQSKDRTSFCFLSNKFSGHYKVYVCLKYQHKRLLLPPYSPTHHMQWTHLRINVMEEVDLNHTACITKST